MAETVDEVKTASREVKAREDETPPSIGKQRYVPIETESCA